MPQLLYRNLKATFAAWRCLVSNWDEKDLEFVFMLSVLFAALNFESDSTQLCVDLSVI